MTAAITTKPLNPFIAAISNFQKFLDRAEDNDLFSAHHRYRAKRRTTEFLAISAVARQNFIRGYNAADRDFATIASTVNYYLIPN